MRQISIVRDGVKIKTNGIVTPIYFMQQRLSKEEKVELVNKNLTTKLDSVEKSLLLKFL
jgi:hypothetical protein